MKKGEAINHHIKHIPQQQQKDTDERESNHRTKERYDGNFALFEIFLD